MENSSKGTIAVHAEAPTVAPAESMAPQPGKKINKLAIVLGVTTLICAGMAGFFGVQYFTSQNNNIQNSNTATGDKTTTDDSSTETSSAAEITQNVMSKEYSEVVAAMHAILDGYSDDFVIQASSILPYKPENIDTYVLLRYSLSTQIRSQYGDLAADIESLNNRMASAGFSSIGTLPFVGSAGPQIYGFQNANGVICGTHYSTISTGIELDCGKSGWDWLTNEQLTLVQNLATAKYEKTGKYPRIIYSNEFVIKEGGVTPYQTIQVSMDGGVGLFYRTSPNSSWQYFETVQSVLECGRYDTEDLKKAYLGEPCYEGPTRSTVQL